MAGNTTDHLYDTNYSITFTKNNTVKNTWLSWHLIPVSRPEIVQPSPVYKFIDIPGRDGQLDITDYLIGRPTFSNRSGAFEFYIVPYGNDDFLTYLNNLKSQLISFFDGTRMTAEILTEVDCTYKGRFFFKGITSDASHSRVTIEYQVDAKKYNIDGTTEVGL